MKILFYSKFFCSSSTLIHLFSSKASILSSYLITSPFNSNVKVCGSTDDESMHKCPYSVLSYEKALPITDNISINDLIYL